MSRKTRLADIGAVVLMISALLTAVPVRAQDSVVAQPTTTSAPVLGSAKSSSAAPSINAAKDVHFDQLLDNQIALNTTFRDENDKNVPLSTYFGDKPVILVMPFYKCPGMCTAELDGMVRLFNDMKKYRAGRDFQVVTISIDPTEKGDLATMKKKSYLNELGQPGADSGWHFLTGDEASIRTIANQIGFHYAFDAKTHQYAHPTGIVLLTNKGKVSRYFFGMGYEPSQVQIALTEAGQGRIGSKVDQVLLYCYHYDPATGKYGIVVFRVIQVAGLATVLILGSFMLIAFRRDSRTPLNPAGVDTEAANNLNRPSGDGDKV